MEQIILQGEIGKDINLIDFQNNKTPLLNSPGGDLYVGFSMYDYNVSNGVEIGVVGVCGSAATIALLGASKKWGTRNSRYLIHNPTGQVNGDAKEMQQKATKLAEEEGKILDIYEKHLNGTREEIKMWMDENVIWSAELALERGLIDEIKDITNGSETPEGSDIKNIFNQFKMKLNMKENKEIELSGISAKLDKLGTLISSFFSPKNIIVQDVNGVELDFGELETEDQIADGATATIDGAAAEGEYVMASGDTYVFEAGVLTIKPAEAATEEMEALQVENQTLTEANATLTQEIQNMTAERDAIKAKFEGVQSDFTEVQTQFSEFKNQFSKTKPVVNTPAVEKTEEKKKFSFKKNN